MAERKRQRKNIIVRKFKSFEEEEKAEVEYWRNLSPKEKLKVLDEIQRMHLRTLYPKGQKFQKVVRIINLGADK